MVGEREIDRVERIADGILTIRGHQVMLDEALARLYCVETRALVQAVKRKIDRFPPDFMFQLNHQELDDLTSQTVISSRAGWGGRRTLPHAFTEQGVAMLSSVLNSRRAVQVNIQIMRTFVKLRRMLASSADLSRSWQPSRPSTTDSSRSSSMPSGRSCCHNTRSGTAQLVSRWATRSRTEAPVLALMPRVPQGVIRTLRVCRECHAKCQATSGRGSSTGLKSKSSFNGLDWPGDVRRRAADRPGPPGRPGRRSAR